jgi:DNA helicase-2/ATP-dependent DNA helicase PcrA
MKTDLTGEKIAAVYRLYDQKLRDNNALDFDDLLIRPLELFVACPDALDFYRNRFRYILVDEYQDTNEAQ